MRLQTRALFLVLATAIVTGSGALLAQTTGETPPPTQPAAPEPPSQPAQAPPQDSDFPKVSVGVLSYLQYSAELQNRGDFNSFDVTRGYINVIGDLTKNVRFRITPDVRRLGDGSLAGSVVLRLKFAYAEFNDVLPRSWIRFGLHQTPWLDFEEGINRYRVQGTMYSEREGIIPGSSDFGIGFLTRFPKDYVEIQAGVYNGEGFTRPEVDKAKSVQIRTTVRPFPGSDVIKGLRLSGFYDLGWYETGQPRRYGIVMGSFEHPHVVGTFQWLAATEQPLLTAAETDRGGISGFLEVRKGMEGIAGFVRFDEFDTDKSRPETSDRRLIVGVAYWLKWDKVRLGLVLNDEDGQFDGQLLRPDENRLLAQVHVQF